MKKQVLGVKIDDLNLDQAVRLVEGWLSKPGQHYVVTPNPEFIIESLKDSEFKNILNQADLAIPDGQGLKIGSDIVCNTPGIDLMESLIKLSNEKAFTIGLLGGGNGVAKKAAECLKSRYKNLRITFAESGGEVNEHGEQVVSSKPTNYQLPTTDILFVAFGHPKQEKWIAKNLKSIPVKVAMGVGGALDYLSGQVPRAPEWIRSLRLEWLFRLILQPWRIKRQLVLIKYLWYVLHSKYI